MGKAKKWWALFLAMIMVLSTIPSVFAEIGPVINVDSKGNEYLVADNDTKIDVVFTQDEPDSNRITATVRVINGGTEDIHIGSMGMNIGFTSAVAPVTKDSEVPFYFQKTGNDRYWITEAETVKDYGRIADAPAGKSREWFADDESVVYAIRSIPLKGGFSSIRIGSPSDYIVFEAGTTTEVYEFYFIPTGTETNFNMDWFRLMTDRVSATKTTKVINYLLQGEAALRSTSDTTVGKNAFSAQNTVAWQMYYKQEKPDASLVTPNYSTNPDLPNTLNGYDVNTMEWYDVETSTWKTAMPEIGNEDITIEVRYKEKPVPSKAWATDTYGNLEDPFNGSVYKTLLASDSIFVTFGASFTWADAFISKTGKIIESEYPENTDTDDENDRTHVGDKIRYTIKATNIAPDSRGEAVWTNANVVDTLDEFVRFGGTVYIHSNPNVLGNAATQGTSKGQYIYQDGKLTAYLGNIAKDETMYVTFDVTVNEFSSLDSSKSIFDEEENRTITNSVIAAGKDKDGGQDLPPTDPIPEPPRKVVDQSQEPTIDHPDDYTKGDTVISGTDGHPENFDRHPDSTITVTITDPDDPTNPIVIEVPVEEDGTWTVDLTDPEYDLDEEDQVLDWKDIIDVIHNEVVEEDGEDVVLDPSDEVSTTVDNRPETDIDVDKTSEDISDEEDDQLIHVGDTIAYTVTVKPTANDPKALLTNVVITDTFPAGVTFNTGTGARAYKVMKGSQDITASVTPVISGGTITFNIGDLYGGEMVTITFDGLVNELAYGEEDATDNDILNRVRATAIDDSTGDPKDDEDTDDSEDPTPDHPVVKRSKKPTITTPIYIGGTEVNGTGGVPGATITVTLPNGATAETDDIDSDGNWTVTPDDVVTGTWPPFNQDDMIYATQKEPEKDISERAEAKVDGRPNGTLETTKTAVNNTAVTRGDSTYRVNDILTYTVQAKNTNTIAASILTGITMTDPIDEFVILDEASIKVYANDHTTLLEEDVDYTWAYEDGVLTVTFDPEYTIYGNQSAFIEFKVQIAPNAYGKDVTNTATVDSKQTEPDPDPEPEIPIVLLKSAAPDIYPSHVGDLTVEGSGIAGSTVYVTLPGNAGYVETAVVDEDGYWSIVLDEGYSLVAGRVIKAYQVEVGKDKSDEVPETVQARPRADGDVYKTSELFTDNNSNGKANVGDQLKYTIELRNMGNRKTTWVLEDFSDELPVGVELDLESPVIFDGVELDDDEFEYDDDELTIKFTPEIELTGGDLDQNGTVDGEIDNADEDEEMDQAAFKRVLTFVVTINEDAIGKNILNEGVYVDGRDKGSGTQEDTPGEEDGDGWDVPEKSAPAIPNPVIRDAEEITGDDGEPGSDIIIRIPNKDTEDPDDYIEIDPEGPEVDDEGNWSVDFPDDYVPEIGDEIEVIQVEKDKEPSDPEKVIVIDKNYRTVIGFVDSMLEDYSGELADILGPDFLPEFDPIVELRPWDEFDSDDYDMHERLEEDDPFRTRAVAVDNEDEDDNYTSWGNRIGQFTFDRVEFGTYLLYINRPGHLPRFMKLEITDPNLQPGDEASDIYVIEAPELEEYGENVFRTYYGATIDNDYAGFDVEDFERGALANASGSSYFENDGWSAFLDLKEDGSIDDLDVGVLTNNLGRSSSEYLGCNFTDDDWGRLIDELYNLYGDGE